MRRTLTSLVLASLLLAVLWPVVGIAVAGPITLIPGYGTSTRVSGLADPQGVVKSPGLPGFPGFRGFMLFIVERSLNRVSFSTGGPPTPFATGLSSPTDLLAAPGFGGGPFGNFLYVAETGTNQISKISNTGAVTPFASLTSTPKRMAFSQGLSGSADHGPSAFGDFLFVTLADGRIVKVSPNGTVSPCASGLSGPEGLVFGPGGSLFKNVLFVAESTANRISKVDPTCTVKSFATGLSAPLGLEISPGVAWGPSDTLYVVNGGTRVDRIDPNGNVTGFASGFSTANSLRFEYAAPHSNRFGAEVHVSDATAGTIEQVFAIQPQVSAQIIGCNPCRAGDTFAVNLTVKNQGAIDAPVEVKTGFRLPDQTPINVAPALISNNKHFETLLPKGFIFSALWLSLTIPAVPAGKYCYEASLTDPELSPFSAFSWSVVCFTILP